jgi:PDZ domain-containing protein
MRRLLLGASVAIVALALVAVPLSFVELNPGPALDVPGQIEFDGPAHPIRGKLLLTTVTITQPSALGALEALVTPHHELLWQTQVIPPGVNEQEYLASQLQVFQESAQAAAAVGLRAAGFPVSVSGGGVQVAGVISGSPADGTLKVGDVITAIDGRPVQLASDLQAATEKAVDGQTVTLTVVRGDQQLQIPIRLRRLSETGRPGLGVALRTIAPKVQLPFPVKVKNQDIGGPSAGLMMSLGIYSLASGDDLSRGRVVAGTGTIDVNGTVGPVGGVAEKIVGAEQRGARIFLVPTSEAADARSAGLKDVTIVPVDTFDHARAALKAAS